jgi:polyhydroxyalkanoate synthesis repressor PhaR
MSPAEQRSEAETVSIVRYPNRRLYDRSQGRYVTLLEIAAMVREGKAVSVRDSKTNEDLTSTILTQIILEHHPERMELLPVPVLHLMIRTNGVVLGFLREYFRQSLTYLDFWQRASAFNPMATSLEWLQSLLPASSAAGASQPPAAASGRTEAETLAQRLAEMERRLNELAPLADKSAEGAGKRAPGPTGPSARRQSGRGRGRPSDKD